MPLMLKNFLFLGSLAGIFFINLPFGFSSQNEGFKAGQDFASQMRAAKPSNAGIVPGFKGSLPPEACLSHAELSKKAAQMMAARDENSPGRVLQEAEEK